MVLKGKTIRSISFGLYKPLQRLFNRFRKPSQPYITYTEKRLKKYLVIGGLIHSMSDEDIHFISARRLVDLYRVRIEDCVLIDSVKCPDFFQYRNQKELIWLMPRSSGNYIVPKKLPIKCDMKDQLIKMGYRNEEWD